MTNCSVIRDLLVMYSDHATSAKTSEIIEEHLENCPECRERYKQIKHVVRSMKRPTKANRYRYSELAQRIHRRNSFILAAGSTAVFSLGVLFAKMMSSSDKD